MTETDPLQLDSPWKEALDQYCPQFIELLFPNVAATIDWTRDIQFTDKELQAIVRDAERGKRWADKLVKVWMKSGQETWIYIHIEVQGQYEADFAKRMYIYHYRISDRYNLPVESLAILADDTASWRPDHYEYQLAACSLKFQFTSTKLLDFLPHIDQLAISRNPCDIVIASHLQAQQTSGFAERRLQWKLRLVKGLYQQGFERQAILDLYRLIDWFLALPDELELEFDANLEAFEQERNMPYITSIERRGIEQGMEKGIEVVRLHCKGLSVQKICDHTGFSIEDVQKAIAAFEADDE